MATDLSGARGISSGEGLSPDMGFSATDCRAYILFRTRNDRPEVEPVEFGEVVTVSVSAHRDKFPIARLGEVNAIGYTGGHRTIAGSLVTLFTDVNTLRRAVKSLFQRFQLIAVWRGPIRPKPDEIPPFDLVLTFVSETATWATVVLKGVTILDEGFQINIEQPNPFISMSFLALDYEVRYPGDEQWLEIPIPIPIARAPLRRPVPLPSLPELPGTPLWRKLLNLLSFRRKIWAKPELDLRRTPEAPAVPNKPVLPDMPVQPTLPEVQPLRPGLGASQPAQPLRDIYLRLQEELKEAMPDLEDVKPVQQIRSDGVVDPWFQASVTKRIARAPDRQSMELDEISDHFATRVDLSLQRVADTGSSRHRYLAAMVDMPLLVPTGDEPYGLSVSEVAYRVKADEMPLWHGLRVLGSGQLLPKDRSDLASPDGSVATLQDIQFVDLPEGTG